LARHLAVAQVLLEDQVIAGAMSESSADAVLRAIQAIVIRLAGIGAACDLAIGVRQERADRRHQTEERPSRLFLVGDLAREARLDIRSFTRAFRSATGLAPYEYLTMRRLQHARDLLQTDRSITEIAMSVGYANPSKFAAAFRRLYDCSPREWRNARR
jgi:AraC-like DNA-binding protein